MLPSATPRTAHHFGEYPIFAVAPTGHLLVRTAAATTPRHRMIAQTFRVDSLVQGVDPSSTLERSVAAVDEAGRLLWCRTEPEHSALSPDGSEIAYVSKRDLVQVSIADGAPTMRRLAFEPSGLIYDGSGRWIYLHDGSVVSRCTRHGDDEPELVFRESAIDYLAFADDALVIFRSGQFLGAFDSSWSCVRQWMRWSLGFSSDLELRRAGTSVLAFNVGHSHVELHDPWWGGLRRLPLQTVHDAEGEDGELRVLVGDPRVVETWRGDELVDRVPTEAPTLWHTRTGLAEVPLSSARCSVAFVGDTPCLFADEHVRGPKSIEEGNTIGAVASIGSTLYVAARNLITAHSTSRRDHRRRFPHAHDQPITAMAACRDHLVSVSVNGKAFVWTSEGERVVDLPHSAAIWDVDSNDGRLATVGDEGVVRVYLDPLSSDAHDVLRLGLCHAVATTANLIAVASRESVTMVSWRGERRWSARGHVATLAAHPHADVFALGTSTGEVLLARPGEQCEISSGHAPFPDLAFSSDGKRLLVGSGNHAHPGAALELELS